MILHYYYSARAPWIERYTSRELTEELNFPKKKWVDLWNLIPVLKEYPEALANLVALYDSEINFVDSSIGELIQKFELDRDTLLVITSDHGEEFLERNGMGAWEKCIWGVNAHPVDC